MIFGIFDSRKFELDGLARKFRRLCTRALATLREETGLRLAGMEWEGRRCAPFVYRHPARPIHLTAKYGLSRAYRGLEFSSKSLGTKLEIPSSSSSSARLVRSCLKYFRLFSYIIFFDFAGRKFYRSRNSRKRSGQPSCEKQCWGHTLCSA